MNNAFPTDRSELLAMFACYALTAALGAMAMFPAQTAHFLIGLLP